MYGGLKSYTRLCQYNYSGFLYGFDDRLWDAIRMDNPEEFVPIYTVRGFMK